MGEKIHRIRSMNGRYKLDRGMLKNSIGNGDAKELTCKTHGHELREGLLERMGVLGGAGGGHWDNSNSIINKINFLKRRV